MNARCLQIQGAHDMMRHLDGNKRRSSSSASEASGASSDDEKCDVSDQALMNQARFDFEKKWKRERRYYLSLTKDMQFRIDDSKDAFYERMKQDPLEFWRKHCPKGWRPAFTRLLSTDEQNLDITGMIAGTTSGSPATSADFERLFSVAGDIVSDRRCRLSKFCRNYGSNY
jgi:hypothetical protein